MLNNRLSGFLPRSLSVRAWLAVGVIVFFATVTASTSAVLAWVSKSDAQALNSVGSIRMATYRINYLLTTNTTLPIDDHLKLDPTLSINQQLIDDMQAHLNVLYAYQNMPGNKDAEIDSQTKTIQHHWLKILKPALINNDSTAVLAASGKYIKEVHELTKKIQVRSETRQHWQQVLQMSALGIILLTLLLGMYELRRNVLRPIHFLIDSTQHFRRGHHVPALVTGYQEFQTLSNSFNDMADTISEHQAKLNQEVLNKTRHLTQANQLLKLLYDFSNQLNQEPVTLSKLHHLLENFSKINPSFGFTLCLHDHLKLNESSTSGPLLKNDTVLVSSKDSISIHSHSVEELQTGKTDLLSSEICSTGNCDQCALKARSTTRIYPISAQNNYWGELMVHQQSEEDDTTITKELVQVLVSLVSLVFTIQKQRQQEHQLILLEERNTIARELHDSLAQSLSYLKIQLSMLGTHARQLSDAAQQNQNDTLMDHNEAMLQVLGQARSGLDAAYIQLRELLVTFRLKIESGSFDNAIEQACDEFSAKGGFNITLDNRILSQNLSANEQIDLLQIIREALSNIQRHAYAKEVTVSLYQKTHLDTEQRIYLEIGDDGVGLPKHIDEQQHHGLKIMQERTHSLGGEFDISQNTPKGTLVRIWFLPKFYEN
ncbi:Nitrate/nitrite sensor protein [Moraxella catarrhalis]|uniref:type IV pili methyl-accepting chemotaxis transducer N-terminal domain-containing protein n=1 Tax=Moraxella catarrhalis TaxID=480 RepID=UPI0007E4D679|nr:type IV pili methyl-accepting chemotaxis transducer N-terminal domain-containing protein [Moraxella catarrhalis]OAV21645.1 Nitrate/nitrite sensor protein [Moraxella catarrhalis]